MFKRLGEGEPEKRITGGTWQVHEIAIPGPIKIKLYWSTALSIIYILATAASSCYSRVEEFGRDSKAQKGSNVYYLEPLQNSLQVLILDALHVPSQSSAQPTRS